MTIYLSNKIKMISFILIVMVVYTHSYNLAINYKNDSRAINNGYNSIFQYFVSHGITRVSVPLFFMISGYLFFLKTNAQNKNFAAKIKKRVSTILIPYLLWSLFGIIFYLTVQTVPVTSSFFSKELVSDYSAQKIISTLLLFPLNYQLWFLRDLFVLTLLAPLIYYSVVRLKYPFLLIIFLAWLTFPVSDIRDFEAFLFFHVGATAGLNHFNIERRLKKNVWLYSCALWLGFALLKVILTICFISSDEWLIFLAHRLSVISGIVCCWTLYDKIFSQRRLMASNRFDFVKYTFFIYAFHEPLLAILKKTGYYILGTNEQSSISIYLVAPIITISVALMLAKIIQTITPRFYHLITGGR